MKDVFHEQLIKRNRTTKDVIQMTLIVMAGLGILYITLPITMTFKILPFAALGVFAAIYFILKRYNKEFEYIFTNGELDIDTIYNKATRSKKSYNKNVRDFIVMIKVSSPDYKSEIGKINKTIDYSIGDNSNDVYACIYEEEGKRIELLIEPNESIFSAIKMYIPRKVK